VSEEKRRRLAELAELEAAADASPTDAEAWLALGRACFDLGMHEQSIAALDRSIRARRVPSDAFEARMLQARALVLSHAAWPDVLDRWLAAHGDDPSRPEPLAALAKAYAERDLDGPSHLFAKRALELDLRTPSLDPARRSALGEIVARVGPKLDAPTPKTKRAAPKRAAAKPKAAPTPRPSKPPSGKKSP
jgi:tetratricopeptide (TPR) repeat protein